MTKYVLIPKKSFEINVETRLPDQYGASKRIIIVVKPARGDQATFADISTWLIKIEHFPQKSIGVMLFRPNFISLQRRVYKSF